MYEIVNKRRGVERLRLRLEERFDILTYYERRGYSLIESTTLVYYRVDYEVPGRGY